MFLFILNAENKELCTGEVIRATTENKKRGVINDEKCKLK